MSWTAKFEQLKAEAEAGTGDPDAAFALAVYYDQGIGTPQIAVEAERWYRKASERGSGGASLVLGQKYRNGEFGPQHKRQALEWFRLAAEQNEPTAQYYFARELFRGELCERDPEEGVKWLTQSAQGGYVLAQSDLANLCLDDESPYFDLPRAYFWFKVINLLDSTEEAEWTLEELRPLVPSQVRQTQDAAAEAWVRDFEQRLGGWGKMDVAISVEAPE